MGLAVDEVSEKVSWVFPPPGRDRVESTTTLADVSCDVLVSLYLFSATHTMMNVQQSPCPLSERKLATVSSEAGLT